MPNYNKNSIHMTMSDMVNATNCIFDVFSSENSSFNPDYVATKIEERTINSRERFRAV
ncbi:hypothetical protein VXS06_18945 [Photobacterium toruni]|uniref:Uncharacterized protein n=1 Tax=Photobacterium toruni TaxID=1935446 RepID=A0ABU6LFZ5_9GAMM|nr:hypothetical protein [Photobacterium toruni]